MRRINRFWIVVVVGLGVAAAALPVTAALLRDPEPDVVATEFNLGGWQRHRGSLDPAITLVDHVRTTEPAAVAVVETCSAQDGQWEHIRAALEPLGYSFVWAPSIEGFDRPRCTEFGNGLAVRGPVDESFATTFDAQRVRPDGPYQELRNIACARFDPPSPAPAGLTACVTHLVTATDDDAETTAAQADEALRFVTERADGPRVVAGDLNLRPSDDALDGWYATHREAAGSRGDAPPTHDSGAKLDYVFVDEATFSGWVSAVVEPVEVSGHHLYGGRFVERADAD